MPVARSANSPVRKKDAEFKSRLHPRGHFPRVALGDRAAQELRQRVLRHFVFHGPRRGEVQTQHVSEHDGTQTTFGGEYVTHEHVDRPYARSAWRRRVRRRSWPLRFVQVRPGRVPWSGNGSRTFLAPPRRRWRWRSHRQPPGRSFRSQSARRRRDAPLFRAVGLRAHRVAAEDLAAGGAFDEGIRSTLRASADSRQ